MSTQIQFRAGHPQKFIATRNFGLGNSGMSIQAGSELEFDGTHVSYAGGHPVAMPQLRGAVKAGWIVLAANYNPNDLSASIPRPAGVQVRDAKGGNPMDPPNRTSVTTASAEEREVGNIRNHAQGVQQRNSDVYQPGRRTASMTVEAQEGVTVRQLTTPAKQSTNFEYESPAEALRRADSVRVQPGVGRTREEMLASMSEEQRNEYLSVLESKKAGYVDAPLVVGTIAPMKNAQKEGFNIHNTVGGGIETADASGMGGEVVESVMSEEGLTFRNTNVGKPKPAPRPVVTASSAADIDTRRRIALAICPDFPDNYVFDDPVRKKIARLQADYEDRPDVIRAVAAADTDLEVRSRLVEEFPGAFA
jgi:hypothetical protein